MGRGRSITDRRSIADQSLYLLFVSLYLLFAAIADLSLYLLSLRLAAQSLRNREHQFGEDGRRMKARLGKAEGITATAHKLARILSAVITRRVAYNEAEAFKQTPATPARRISNLQKQAAKFGLQLLPAS